MYIHHWVNELYLNFYLVPCLVVQDIWQLKYRLFRMSNHFSFLLFLTYSFYVFFNIHEYENYIFRIHIIIGSYTCISTIIWYQILKSRMVSSWRRGNLVGIPP